MVAETLFDHADGGAVLTVFDEGVDSRIEVADLGESMYKRPHGGRNDVSLWMDQEGNVCGRGRYHVIEEDELVEVIMVGDGELHVFAGYALKEVEGVAQEEMLWEACPGWLGGWVREWRGEGLGSTCSRAVIAENVCL